MGEVEVEPGIEAVRVMSGDHGVEVLREILAAMGERPPSGDLRRDLRCATRRGSGSSSAAAPTAHQLAEITIDGANSYDTFLPANPPSLCSSEHAKIWRVFVF
jgi:hypothetical protein